MWHRTQKYVPEQTEKNHVKKSIQKNEILLFSKCFWQSYKKSIPTCSTVISSTTLYATEQKKSKLCPKSHSHVSLSSLGDAWGWEAAVQPFATGPEGSGWRQVQHNPVACSSSPKGQLYPEVHQAQRCHQVGEGAVPFHSALCSLTSFNGCHSIRQKKNC